MIVVGNLLVVRMNNHAYMRTSQLSRLLVVLPCKCWFAELGLFAEILKIGYFRESFNGAVVLGIPKIAVFGYP